MALIQGRAGYRITSCASPRLAGIISGAKAAIIAVGPVGGGRIRTSPISWITSPRHMALVRGGANHRRSRNTGTCGTRLGAIACIAITARGGIVGVRASQDGITGVIGARITVITAKRSPGLTPQGRIASFGTVTRIVVTTGGIVRGSTGTCRANVTRGAVNAVVAGVTIREVEAGRTARKFYTRIIRAVIAVLALFYLTTACSPAERSGVSRTARVGAERVAAFINIRIAVVVPTITDFRAGTCIAVTRSVGDTREK